MGEESTRQKILGILNSYPAMIALAILIGCECLDLVAEVMIEQEIRDTMVEDNTRIRSFVLKLKHTDDSDLHQTSTIKYVILSINNVLNVYNTKAGDKNNYSNCSWEDLSTQSKPAFRLNFLSDNDNIFCGMPSNVGHLDIGEVTKRTDQTLQDAGFGLRVFGLVNIIFMALETCVRIICSGKLFIKKKVEVFDSCVVFISLILDCVFFNNEFQSSSTIILLLLPWRIIRIINSLIMAINNKHKLQIKNLRIEKKKLEERQMKLRNILLDVKGNQERLTDLCRRKGATDGEISTCIYQRKTQMTLAAVSTVASMMLIGSPVIKSIEHFHQSTIMDSFVAQPVTSDDSNNNNVQKHKPSISDYFQRRSISTPNLFRNLPMSNTSTPYIIAGTRFISPLLFMTPVRTPTTQNVFFPADFEYNIVRDGLSAVRAPSLSSVLQQSTEIPEIVITEHRD